MYPIGEPVKVLGRAPGWSWLFVETQDGMQGWMKLELLTVHGSIYDVPVIEPEGWLVVKGHVYTPAGSPASEITVTLAPPEPIGDYPDDAATTDILGQFYFFLPPDSSGDWTLKAQAYGCNSTAVNNACYLLGEFPPAQTIDVGQSAEIWHNLEIKYP